MENLRKDLSTHTSEGQGYRIDLRLRPHGRSGELVYAIDDLLQYYEASASLWEVQALLKLRPAAGSLPVGHKLLERLQPIFRTARDPKTVVECVQHMRALAMKEQAKKSVSLLNVKVGKGGIRDIEFLVQGLQLIHIPKGHPHLANGNTLTSLNLLEGIHALDTETVSELKQDYMFLRRIEHYLQFLEDRQIHSLPAHPKELEALAKRTLGTFTTVDRFMQLLGECQIRVHKAYERYLITKYRPS